MTARASRSSAVQRARVPREVFELLAASKTPLKPYALLWRLQNARGRQMPPSSVYRALAVLADAGLVHRIGALGGAYVACTVFGRPHEPAFLVCERCGSALEIDAGASQRLLEKRVSATGFLVTSWSFVAHGDCRCCRDREIAGR